MGVSLFRHFSRRNLLSPYSLAGLQSFLLSSLYSTSFEGKPGPGTKTVKFQSDRQPLLMASAEPEIIPPPHSKAFEQTDTLMLLCPHNKDLLAPIPSSLFLPVVLKACFPLRLLSPPAIFLSKRWNTHTHTHF